MIKSTSQEVVSPSLVLLGIAGPPRVAVLMLLCMLAMCSSYVFAQTPESLAHKAGCFECHRRTGALVGPAFDDIAVRYAADVRKFELRVQTVDELAELPSQLESTVVLARVAGSYHLRIHDPLSNVVVDELVSELDNAKTLTELCRQLPWERQLDSTKLAEKKRLVLEAVHAATSGSRDEVRTALIRTVNQGGKGHWTATSKGVPMPPFVGRLKSEDVGRLVDWILEAKAGMRLRTMAVGLGGGRITSDPPGITCPGDCSETFAEGTKITLTATPDVDSEFVRWVLDPEVTTKTLTVTMDGPYSVRAEFRPAVAIPPLTTEEINPSGIATYLAANPQVDTVAEFLDALPRDYRQNWILMSRSESLQTGTAKFPRILLPNKNARNVFTVGVAVHSSYPGAHPNAIEYMQWDGEEKNFRFHEIVLATIPAMHPINQPDGSIVHTFPARPRAIAVDDAKCTKCHSTQNVLNPSSFPGTTGVSPPFTIKAKSKPNWDTYDSWGGMLPLNRDRIYSGSVEAAAFRRIFDPWTWQSEPSVRSVIEQLELQPPGVPDGTGGQPDHRVKQIKGGEFDGHVRFGFDASSPVLIEPKPVGNAISISTSYAFDGQQGSGTSTPVIRGGKFVTLHHSETPTSDEGRAVQLFDLLGGLDGDFNAQRVADELIEHRFATGSIPIDVRPVALAISKRLLEIDEIANEVRAAAGLPALTIDSTFFDQRNGMQITQLRDDTIARATDLPRRKADIQRINLDRSGDVYLRVGDTTKGLVLEDGAKTYYGVDVSLPRLRQEVFRRPIDDGVPDATAMGGIYVDREFYAYNSHRMALFRYFLEPLGVSVDKWSMGVRGRSRTYTFADVFGTYVTVMENDLRDSLLADPRNTGLTNPFTDAELLAAVNQSLSALPAAQAVPKFTDVQRIFNKSCIECHGGLNYPPYVDFGTSIDFSEDEAPPGGSKRLDRSHAVASRWASNLATSKLYQRLINPSEDCGYVSGVQMMPCGGPSLSNTDIGTIRRWIVGGEPYSVGDPHLRTVDGTTYSLQAAGEFIALLGENFEVQVRQTAVGTTKSSVGDEHTGLSSGVSINSAIAIRLGQRRITYQPTVEEEGRPSLQLRIDGKSVELPAEGLAVAQGARVLRTIAPNGICVEAPGGTAIIITPGFWEHFQLWYFNIDTRQVRATDGLMGTIAPGNWLPALSDGRLLGSKPANSQQRQRVLYKQFANSWRVTDSTTLFDYEPGMSTQSYAVPDWPSFDKKASVLPPPSDGGTGRLAPVEGLTREEAIDLSAAIVDPALREHCIHDLIVTGNRGFVDTYLLTDRIRRNAPPSPPVLLSPTGQARNLDQDVKFQWRHASDPEGEEIKYHLYAWPTSVLPDNNEATPVSASDKHTDSTASMRLRPRQSYYWKVIAEDGQGRTVESTTNRFDTK